MAIITEEITDFEKFEKKYSRDAFKFFALFAGEMCYELEKLGQRVVIHFKLNERDLEWTDFQSVIFLDYLDRKYGAHINHNDCYKIERIEE